MEDSVRRKADKTIVPKKDYSLADYRKEKKLDNVLFKEQQYIPLSGPYQYSTGTKGIPTGKIVLLLGHTDSSKTTAMIETAVNAQKMNILPVFIITEMKWSWDHAKQMGFEYTEIKDADGKITGYDGFFLYIDRSSLKTIEDVAMFINKTIDDQEKGLLPYDLCFMWDSIGSIPCAMSVEKQKNNNEWNAGAMSVQFGGGVNQRISTSSKADSKFTNTLVCVNKVWVLKPDNPMAQPKIQPKGGMTMWFDAALVIQFGNEKNSGGQKVKAIKNGREISFGRRVNISVVKNHINGIDTKAKIIVTPHGYILDTKEGLEDYKKNNLEYFSQILGEAVTEGSFEVSIDEEEDTSFDLSSLNADD
jgi:hypothetical protein